MPCGLDNFWRNEPCFQHGAGKRSKDKGPLQYLCTKPQRAINANSISVSLPHVGVNADDGTVPSALKGIYERGAVNPPIELLIVSILIGRVSGNVCRVSG